MEQQNMSLQDAKAFVLGSSHHTPVATPEAENPALEFGAQADFRGESETLTRDINPAQLVRQEMESAFANAGASAFDREMLRKLTDPTQKFSIDFKPEDVRLDPSAFMQTRDSLERILNFVQSAANVKSLSPEETLSKKKELKELKELSRLGGLEESQLQEKARLEAELGNAGSSASLRKEYKSLQKILEGESNGQGAKETGGILGNLDAIAIAAQKGLTSQEITLRNHIKAEFALAGASNQEREMLASILDGESIPSMRAGIAQGSDANSNLRSLQKTLHWLAVHAGEKGAEPGNPNRASYARLSQVAQAGLPHVFHFNLGQHIQNNLRDPARGLLPMPSGHEYQNVSAELDRLIKFYTDTGLRGDPVCQHAIQSKHDWEWKKLTQQWSPETTRLHNQISNEVNSAPQQRRPTLLQRMPADGEYTRAYEGLNQLIKTYESMLKSYDQTGVQNPHMQQIYRNAIESRNYWANEKLKQVSNGPLHRMIEDLRARAPAGQVLTFIPMQATPQVRHDLDWLIHAYTAAGKADHPVCKIAERTKQNLQPELMPSAPASQQIRPQAANSFPAPQKQGGFRNALRNLFK